MNVFHEDNDHARFIETLAKYKEKYSFRLYHYVLMTNHVHLVIKPSEKGGTLSEIMKSINLSYAQYYKHKYKHIGHFWQDRFKSIIVSNDRYLLSCGAYVELNPVRARMVNQPKEYPWSSYNVYAYGKADGVTDEHSVYDALGEDSSMRRKEYRNMIKEWIERDKMKGIMDKRAIYGSEEFTENMRDKHGIESTIRPVGRPKKRKNEIN